MKSEYFDNYFKNWNVNDLMNAIWMIKNNGDVAPGGWPLEVYQKELYLRTGSIKGYHDKSVLPELCFSLHPSTQEWIVIKRGETGQYTTNWGKATQDAVDMKNQQMGVTKAQAAAMVAGSVFGWDTKVADPLSYDENGISKQAKKNDVKLEEAYKTMQNEGRPESSEYVRER